ncbi:MAG: CocE/NonD family hydrolase, partial [Elstera sp.]
QREAPRFFGSRAPYLPLASRADVLVFETAPLEDDLDVTGPVVAELFVQSSAPDVDLCIKLIDVYPPSSDYPQGFALNLTDGIQRCRFRDGWEVPQPMDPDTIYRVRVEAFPTANLFKAGHRLRLDIASSNFPHFDVNPQTGAPAWKSGPTQTATVRIYLDAAHPSRLLLPVNPTATPLLNQTQGDE